MADTAIHTLTASQIANRIRMGLSSVSEVAESFIERSRAFNPALKAFVAFDEEYVRSQARELDGTSKQGLLAGVPVGVKDIINTQYYPTQKGSPAWEGYRAGNDARCVYYIRSQQAVVFSKTDTAELAVHANGNALNPYDFHHVTGSSSGGSAAAVAAGMVPAALGTQTGGSIIRPASWCGVYAMKPSFGLIPRTGVLKTTDTLDSIGFFGRSSEDLALLFDAIRIRGENFPLQEAELERYNSASREVFRIGFCRSHMTAETQPYVLKELEEFKRAVSEIPNIEIVEVDLPKSTHKFQSLHRRIYHPCLAYYLRAEAERGRHQLSQILLEIFEDAATIPPEDYGVALREQSALAEEMESFFREYRLDALLTNSSNGSAPVSLEPDRHLDLNALWTMSWLPVINVPAFKCAKGLPYGLQMVGPRFSEYRLFSLLSEMKSTQVIPAVSELKNPGVRSVESGAVLVSNSGIVEARI